MMKKKDIEEWYEEIKELYDVEEKSNNLPEGDFNELQCEYLTLRSILQID